MLTTRCRTKVVMSDEKNETNKSAIKVLDGGFSSQISRYDKSFDGHPLWSSLFLHKNPELVFETHLDYLRGMTYIIII